MKKIYSRPEIECTTVKTEWVLNSIGGTVQDNVDKPGTGGTPGGKPTGAPRKPF